MNRCLLARKTVMICRYNACSGALRCANGLAWPTAGGPTRDRIQSWLRGNHHAQQYAVAHRYFGAPTRQVRPPFCPSGDSLAYNEVRGCQAAAPRPGFGSVLVLGGLDGVGGGAVQAAGNGALLHDVLAPIGDKWRFNEFRRLAEGITQRMLSATLHH